MATFFTGQRIWFWGYYQGQQNWISGNLTGDVSRSGNIVTLSNLRLTGLTPLYTPAYGTDYLEITVGGAVTGFSVSASDVLNDKALNNCSFEVGVSETYREVAWSTSDGAGGTFGVSFPSGATPPTNLTLSDLVPGIDSFTATVSVSGWGQNPSSILTDRYRELQVWTYSASGLTHPRRYEAEEGDALSSSITVDNDSSSVDTPPLTIGANTRYVIGIYATNGNANTGSQRYGDAYTLPPTPTSASSGAQTYRTFNSVNCPITISYPADGGGLTKTLQYRLRKGSGSYGSWTSFGTVSSGDAGSLTDAITLDTDSTYTVEFRSYTSAGVSPSTVTVAITTLQTHEAPTFTDFDYQDANPDTVAVTSDSSYLISNLSILRMEVPVSKKATPFDPNYPVIKYAFTYEDATLEQPFSDSQTVGVSFGAASQSGVRPISVNAVDSLGANTTVSKNIIVLPYAEPTLTMTATRIDEAGNVQLSVGGNYSPLIISGTPKNSLIVEYKLSDTNGIVIDWTPITITITDGEYTGSVSSIPTDFGQTYLLETRTIDAFSTVVASETLSAYEKANLLDTPQYSIEVWTRDGSFIADISKYLTSDLNISWTLNDIEEVNFSASLDALELLRQNGASTIDLLAPYAHDVRIRRNGEYIVGCQVVEANIKIDNDQNQTVQVKGTGYLNIFKDQYLSLPFAGYSYPVMAHRLIYYAQHADTLLRNPTGDIDASYWLSSNGTIAQTSVAKDGAGAIQGYSTGPQVMGSQMRVPANTPVHYDFWVSVSTAGSIAIQERDLITNASTPHAIAIESISATNTYTHITGDFITSWDNGYFCIRNGTNGVTMRLDDVYVSRADDEDALNNHYVGTIYGGGGSNSATSGYVSDREFNYELQNVKDAVMTLVNMGEDNFDFEFTPDRKFKTYERKGEDRTDIEILYPGNVHSMTIERSAADMANKVQEIGSGIGDERLEVVVSDTSSRQLYGTHESVITANNVSLEDTLEGLAQGELEKRSPINPALTVTIQDGSINCGNIETGDALAFRIGNYLGVLGQQQTPQIPVPMELLGDVEGWYRVKQINARISQDGIETLNLQLEFEGSFEES